MGGSLNIKIGRRTQQWLAMLYGYAVDLQIVWSVGIASYYIELSSTLNEEISSFLKYRCLVCLVFH